MLVAGRVTKVLLGWRIVIELICFCCKGMTSVLRQGISNIQLAKMKDLKEGRMDACMNAYMDGWINGLLLL